VNATAGSHGACQSAIDETALSLKGWFADAQRSKAALHH